MSQFRECHVCGELFVPANGGCATCERRDAVTEIAYRMPGSPIIRYVGEEEFWKAKGLTADVDSDDIEEGSLASVCFDCCTVREMLDDLAAQDPGVQAVLWGLDEIEWRRQVMMGLAALVREIEQRTTTEL